MINEIFELFRGIDWPTLIIGAIIGAIVPILGKWIFSLFKKREEKYHLSLIHGQASDYSSMSDGDVSVSIQYKGEDYKGVLSVLVIGLENDGRNAISFSNHFDKPILIRSNSFKIVDVQNISEEKIKADVSLVGGTVRVSWGLLKKGERIVFRIVGEYIESDVRDTKERSTLFDSLSFNVRSDCVDYIKPRRVSFKYLALLSFVTSVIFGLAHYLTLDKKDYEEEVYSFNYDGEIITGRLQFDENSSVYTISPPDSISLPSRLFDFKRYPKITINNVRNQRTFILIFYSCVWLFFLLISGIIVAFEKKRDDRKVFED